MINNLFTQLANVSIPSEINLTGAFDVNVKLNGAEVLAKIEPRVKEMMEGNDVEKRTGIKRKTTKNNTQGRIN